MNSSVKSFVPSVSVPEPPAAALVLEDVLEAAADELAVELLLLELLPHAASRTVVSTTRAAETMTRVGPRDRFPRRRENDVSDMLGFLLVIGLLNPENLLL